MSRKPKSKSQESDLLTKAKKIHFIGIGGAGMSGIAKVLLNRGYEVSGSDLKQSQNTRALENEGARINIGHDAKNVEGAEVLVYSTAIPKQNPELKYAEENSVPMIPRGEMLSHLAENKTTIAVAGTHGKTTTTSMIALALDKSKLLPTFLIGGELNDIGSNAKYGEGDYFIAEVDESDGSFLHIKPDFAVITSIESEHLDYYKTFDEIKVAFRKFIRSISPQGWVIAYGDYPIIKGLIAEEQRNYITYGLDNANTYVAKDIELSRFGSVFTVLKEDNELGKVRLKVPGNHNVLNAMATIATTLQLGIDFEKVSLFLSEFSGVKRRYQLLGSAAEITLVDDYAHHPTEVEATLKTARSGEWERIICIFQPHRFSRTWSLGRDFKDSFKLADRVILTDVYAAGEEPIPGVSGKLIVDAILEANPRSVITYLPKKSKVTEYLTQISQRGDLVLTMGAGDIWTIGEEFLESLAD